jgi:hypothetical protein
MGDCDALHNAQCVDIQPRLPHGELPPSPFLPLYSLPLGSSTPRAHPLPPPHPGPRPRASGSACQRRTRTPSTATRIPAAPVGWVRACMYHSVCIACVEGHVHNLRHGVLDCAFPRATVDPCCPRDLHCNGSVFLNSLPPTAPHAHAIARTHALALARAHAHAHAHTHTRARVLCAEESTTQPNGAFYGACTTGSVWSLWWLLRGPPACGSARGRLGRSTEEVPGESSLHLEGWGCVCFREWEQRVSLPVSGHW